MSNQTELFTIEEIMEQIESNEELSSCFYSFSQGDREMFLDICSGKHNFPITYDSFFKYVFDVNRHPERLNAFLSAVMGNEVTIVEVIPKEHYLVNELGHMVIMDIVVKLSDGSLVDVEIQKNPYEFLGERASCYTSDMIMRSYQDLLSANKDNKANYKSLKPVYTIIILEESTKAFKKFPQDFIHRGKCKFDTGLEIEMLENYIYIPLDIFCKSTQNKDTIENDLEAWLTLFGSAKENRLLKLVKQYPQFIEICNDINNLRRDIKEVMTMFSKELAILDRNTQEYMVDEMRHEIEQKDIIIGQKDIEIEQMHIQIEQMKAELEQFHQLAKANKQ